MLVEQGQIVYVQGLVTAVAAACIRKVLFSDFEEPHDSSTKMENGNSVFTKNIIQTF